MRRIGPVVGALVLASIVVGTGGPRAGGAETCTVRGTTGDDVLVGTPGPDVLCGLGGNDVLRGGGGDDALYGAAGDDLLIGRDGADELVGGDGVDRLVPGRGNDVVNGGTDSDAVKFRDLAGGVNVFLEEGIAGGAVSGADYLTSIEGVVGTTGDDFLSGTADEDVLRGFGGDDVLFPGGGPDHLDGGDGTDRVDYSNLNHGVTVALDRHWLFDGGAGRIVGVEDILGTRWDDRLSGDDGPNVLSGWEGSDQLSGGGGDDTLEGDRGADDLAGGDGADELWPGIGRDAVDGGAEPGDALAGDVLRYDDIERWVRQQTCELSGDVLDCDFVNWQLLGGGLTIDLDVARVEVSVGYSYFGHNFQLSESDTAADIEAAYATPLDDRLLGGRGATAVALCGMRGKDTIDTQDGYGGDLFDAVGVDVRTQDPGDSATTC